MEPILKNAAPNMPRTDYPRPMWTRNEWYCLNGEWEFEFDPGVSGEERRIFENGSFSRTITVPFCPESKLSGIGCTDFMPAVWYRRKINIQKPNGRRAILHFGAVDFLCKVWVNGSMCGAHEGGYCSFEFDITDKLCDGENTIVVMAIDDLRSKRQSFGKQCDTYFSRACSYTRTTGIWQTVWLEYVPEVYLLSQKIIPHAADGAVDLSIKASCCSMKDYSVKLTAFYEGKAVGCASARFVGDVAAVRLFVDEIHLWEVLDPKLYDLKIELIYNEQSVDTVESYFALRDIAYDKKGLLVNGKHVFMRLILDQGFNPDGIYTAPDVEFLKKDIELSIALGFNGARLHQRIFEESTLYYADKLGYIIWAEAPSGIDLSYAEATELFLHEWMEIVDMHYNHPAVIGWCPFNETYHELKLHKGTHTTVYHVTKALDPYRPVIDASGGVHYETDMYDIHDYEQDPAKLASYLAPMLSNPSYHHSPIKWYRGNAPEYPENYCGQAS